MVYLHSCTVSELSRKHNLDCDLRSKEFYDAMIAEVLATHPIQVETDGVEVSPISKMLEFLDGAGLAVVTCLLWSTRKPKKSRLTFPEPENVMVTRGYCPRCKRHVKGTMEYVLAGGKPRAQMFCPNCDRALWNVEK